MREITTLTSPFQFVWRRALVNSIIVRLPPLILPVDGRRHIDQPYDCCCDSVPNDRALWRGKSSNLLRQLQPEATVDDSEGDSDASNPDMSVAPHDTT